MPTYADTHGHDVLTATQSPIRERPNDLSQLIMPLFRPYPTTRAVIGLVTPIQPAGTSSTSGETTNQFTLHDVAQQLAEAIVYTDTLTSVTF